MIVQLFFKVTVTPDIKTFCPGSTVKLTAKGSPSGTYRWTGDRTYANTAVPDDSIAIVNIPSGATGTYAFFISSSYLECASTIKTELVVSPTAIPSVTIKIDSGCPSRKLILKATAVNGGTTPVFSWYRNQETAPIGTGETFTYQNATNTDKISCRLAIGEGNCSNTREVSADTLAISCIVSGVQDIVGLKDFKIFPNPTSGIFSVKLLQDKPTMLKIIIRNALGQIVQTQHPLSISGNIEETIDLNDKPKGLYWVETWIDKQVVIQKIVVQ